jgi:hypothetical protein
MSNNQVKKISHLRIGDVVCIELRIHAFGKVSHVGNNIAMDTLLTDGEEIIQVREFNGSLFSEYHIHDLVNLQGLRDKKNSR